MSGPEAQTPLARIARLFREEDRFLVASHYNPDGDALGSLAATGFVLQALGKEFRLFNISGVPTQFDWVRLPGPVACSPEELGDFEPDWIVLLDCGDLHRAGEPFVSWVDRDKLINIDHHLGNPEFGCLNWVDPTQPAVGAMVAELARTLDVPLANGLGEAVYLALVTDTGHFSYTNTSAETMELAAEILRHGLDPSTFTDRLENQWSMNRLRLWQRVLSGAEFYCLNRIGVLRITRRMMTETGTTAEDTDGLVEFVRKVRDVDVAVVLRDGDPAKPRSEQAEGGALPNNVIKFSLRSKGETNVQAVARALGGGGHRNAAGGQLEGPMEHAREELVRTIMEQLGLAGDSEGPQAEAAHG